MHLLFTLFCVSSIYESNIILNITSKSITLNSDLLLLSDITDNVTITGNGVTIMCNYKGSVSVDCNLCNNTVIEGITWDECGTSSDTLSAIDFSGVSNIKLHNCTFQYSQMRAVSIEPYNGTVIIDGCNFIANSRNHTTTGSFSDIGGLRIEKVSTDFVNVFICNSTFIGNGDFSESEPHTDGFGLYVHVSRDVGAWNVTISKSTFSFNAQAAHIILYEGNITLFDVTVHNNTVADSTVVESVFVLEFTAQDQSKSNAVNILSSRFIGNKNKSALSIQAKSDITVQINDSTFIDNRSPFSSIVDIVLPEISECSLTLQNVQISGNQINDTTENPILNNYGIFSTKLSCYTTYIHMIRVNSISNIGSVVYIQSIPCLQMELSECVFYNNTTVRGPTLYIDKHLDIRGLLYYFYY